MVKVLADALCFFLTFFPPPAVHTRYVSSSSAQPATYTFILTERACEENKNQFFWHIYYTHIDINRIQSYQDFNMVISRTNMSTIISHKLVHLRQQSRHSVSSSSPQPASCSGSIALHAVHRRRLHESMHVSFSSSSSLSWRRSIRTKRGFVLADCINNARWSVRKMSSSLSSEIDGTGNTECVQLMQVVREIHIPQYRCSGDDDAEDAVADNFQ